MGLMGSLTSRRIGSFASLTVWDLEELGLGQTHTLRKPHFPYKQFHGQFGRE